MPFTSLFHKSVSILVHTIIRSLFEFTNMFSPKVFGYISMFVFIGDAVVHVLKMTGKCNSNLLGD